MLSLKETVARLEPLKPKLVGNLFIETTDGWFFFRHSTGYGPEQPNQEQLRDAIELSSAALSKTPPHAKECELLPESMPDKPSKTP